MRLVPAVLFTLLAYPLSAQYPTPDSLKGIPQIHVRIFADRPFSQVTVKPIVQQMLSDAKIPFTFDSASPDENPILNLSIYANPAPNSPTIGYHVELSLTQNVQLARDPKVKVVGSTWRNDYSNSIPKSQLTHADLLQVDVRSLIGGFVGDFKKANLQ